MFSTNETLKSAASSLFADGLAQSVAQQIDDAAQDQAQRLPSVTRGAPASRSIATLFLADRFYSKLRTGQFSGRIMVSWDGMDDFVFVPDPQKPFRYTTAAGRVIEPRLMRTDGGSIPRLLRGLQKFSSWGYAPAFLVHDWLFTAQKCQHAPDIDWAFDQTAQVMAEAIKTLMEVGYTNWQGDTVKLAKAEDTLYLMYQAVASPIAQDLWDDHGSVVCMV